MEHSRLQFLYATNFLSKKVGRCSRLDDADAFCAISSVVAVIDVDRELAFVFPYCVFLPACGCMGDRHPMKEIWAWAAWIVCVLLDARGLPVLGVPFRVCLKVLWLR